MVAKIWTKDDKIEKFVCSSNEFEHFCGSMPALLPKVRGTYSTAVLDRFKVFARLGSSVVCGGGDGA